MRANFCAFIVLAAAAATPLSGARAAALAADSQDPFAALTGKRERAEDRAAGEGRVERFVTASGERAFLFETYGDAARIKFLCGPKDPRLDCAIDDEAPAEEIFVLFGNRAPRGDTIYKNADGDAVLRLTSYGGSTVFWPGESAGVAASRTFGEDAALSLFPISEELARARARKATALLSAQFGAPVEFEIAEPVGVDETVEAAVLADAIARAAKGVASVYAGHTGAAKRPPVTSIRFHAGEEPDARVEDDALIVVYNPHRDIRGRLGSAEIAHRIRDAD